MRLLPPHSLRDEDLEQPVVVDLPRVADERLTDHRLGLLRAQVLPKLLAHCAKLRRADVALALLVEELEGLLQVGDLRAQLARPALDLPRLRFSGGCGG